MLSAAAESCLKNYPVFNWMFVRANCFFSPEKEINAFAIFIIGFIGVRHSDN